MNEHFQRFREDNVGIAAQRNHAAALAELVRACEPWAELGNVPPSVAMALASVHAVGREGR